MTTRTAVLPKLLLHVGLREEPGDGESARPQAWNAVKSLMELKNHSLAIPQEKSESGNKQGVGRRHGILQWRGLPHC